MVPLAVIKAKKEAAKAEAENRPSASERREKKREAMSDARRYANGVSVTAMLVAILLGTAVAAWIDRPGPSVAAVFSGILLGLFLLFSIKIANQWERAVVLRFGKFVGLKGPGLFGIVPIVDTVSSLIDQRVRVTDVTAESGADPRHGAGLRRRHRLLDGLGRQEVGARGGRLRGRGHALRADGPARGDRPPHAGRDDHRARAARQGAPEDPRREDESRGGSPCTPSRSATCASRRSSRTR